MNISYSISSLFVCFMIYSIVGWVYESLLCTYLFKKWVNRGFLNGPYCPIYGSGAVLVLIVLGNIQNTVVLFFASGILALTLEYFTSWAMEKLFHARWWDYSDQKFNINGRVCLLGFVAFSTFCTLLIKFIQPFVWGYVGQLLPWQMSIVATALLVIFVVDIFITVTGITGFNEKLKSFSGIIKARKETIMVAAERYKETVTDKIKEHEFISSVTSLYDSVVKRMNNQELRMIKTFPKLKSTTYNETLVDIRKLMDKVRRIKK